jgi:hypothetical protein
LIVWPALSAAIDASAVAGTVVELEKLLPV